MGTLFRYLAAGFVVLLVGGYAYDQIRGDGDALNGADIGERFDADIVGLEITEARVRDEGDQAIITLDFAFTNIHADDISVSADDVKVIGGDGSEYDATGTNFADFDLQPNDAEDYEEQYELPLAARDGAYVAWDPGLLDSEREIDIGLGGPE